MDVNLCPELGNIVDCVQVQPISVVDGHVSLDVLVLLDPCLGL